MRIIIIRVLMNENDDNASRSQATARTGSERPSSPRRVTSSDLFAGGREIVILHDGRQYFLRITQNGKLILTA